MVKNYLSRSACSSPSYASTGTRGCGVLGVHGTVPAVRWLLLCFLWPVHIFLSVVFLFLRGVSYCGVCCLCPPMWAFVQSQCSSSCCVQGADSAFDYQMSSSNLPYKAWCLAGVAMLCSLRIGVMAFRSLNPGRGTGRSGYVSHCAVIGQSESC